MMISFENSAKGLCVSCGRRFSDDLKSEWICLKCRKVCAVHPTALPERLGPFITDVKSECCGADVKQFGRITCSDSCHENFVKEMEKQFGVFKKVVDEGTGKAYRVPTRDFIERGLTYEDLRMGKYPLWEVY
jgi:hypothetical protein